MKKIFLKVYFFSILSIISQAIFGQKSFFGSTVRVYSKTSSGTTKGGTGFAIKINDKKYIATCYHVINQATSIEVFSIALQTTFVCKVVAFDDFKDIALLDASSISKLEPIDVSNIPPNLWKLDGTAIGNPNSNNEFILKVNFTFQNGVMGSNALSDNSGDPVFLSSIPTFNVIPISSFIYGGMSGAPIIVNDKVIGIISGSENQGGSIGWGIPVAYFNQLSISKNLFSTIGLSPLKSLAGSQHTLFRSIVFDESTRKNTFAPFQETYNELTPDFSSIQSNYQKSNSLISNFLLMSKGLTVNSDPGKIHEIRELIDSIYFYDGAGTQGMVDFCNDKKTFDDLLDILKNNSISDPDAKSDTVLLNKAVSDLANLSVIENINSVKYNSKSAEAKSALGWISHSMFYTDQNIINELSQWKDYLIKDRDANNSSIEYYNVQLQECSILFQAGNVFCESLTFK